ncbi:putative glucuronoxylan glucuronosyltransferase F8H [Drosera capensis]
MMDLWGGSLKFQCSLAASISALGGMDIVVVLFVRGWFGADCSIPSIFSSIREWPRWLRPAQVEIPDTTAQFADSSVTPNAAVKKKRPLIYVYDLPPEFDSFLLEMTFYESILSSPHRTLNGDEADFYFVPVLDSCIITRADDAPHLCMKDHRGLRSSFALEFYKKAYDHIAEQYSYWNRSSGKDHIWFFSWDEGACYAPKEIWNSVMLVHWGNTNSKHNHSNTTYWADNWDGILLARRGNHPCFDPNKDLVLPAWKRPDLISLKSKLWARPRDQREHLFYFNGNLGPAYANGRPEAASWLRSLARPQIRKGSSGSSTRMIVTPVRSVDYYEALAASLFCGVLPGDGWSGRFEDSVLQGCTPVVIQDGIFLPYENVLNYNSFAVRIREEEIPNMIKILRRFFYRGSMLLEAERQRLAFGRVEDWATELSQLHEDDVFASFISQNHATLRTNPHHDDFKHTPRPWSCTTSYTMTHGEGS